MLKEPSSLVLVQYILLQVHPGRGLLVLRVYRHGTTRPSTGTTFYLERYNRQNPADPLKRRKHVVGIFGDYFLLTVQLHHLIGLDPNQHFLGQQKHSSKAINTTVLQDGTSEYSLPFRTSMCLSISIH